MYIHVYVSILAFHIVHVYVYITDNRPCVFVCVLVRTVLLESVVLIGNQCTNLHTVQYIIAWAELYLEIPLKRSKVKVWRNKRGQAYLNVNDVRLDKSTGWGGVQMSPCAALNAPQMRNGIIRSRTTGSTMIADIPCGNEEQLSSVPLIPYLYFSIHKRISDTAEGLAILC